MAFVDLEKAFDSVWWALRKLGVEEWIMQLVQEMYANPRSRVRVGEGFSQEPHLKLSPHLKKIEQGSSLGAGLFCSPPNHNNPGLQKCWTKTEGEEWEGCLI